MGLCYECCDQERIEIGCTLYKNCHHANMLPAILTTPNGNDSACMSQASMGPCVNMMELKAK